jgi:peptidoglycan/LPS O-acetylase OafA/YrhL
MQIQNASRTPAASRIAVSSFIPALDGLRGVAIIAVLLFHLDFPKCSLGWAGVELFFVISGFLITRILLNTRDNRNYFSNFYYRRTLRIFPIYYLVITIYTALKLFSSGDSLRNLPFYYLYLQTIPQLQSHFREMPMLGHTWSLAIEEQFYLIWPMAVFLLRGRKLFVMISMMIITGLGMRFYALEFANPFLIDGWLGVQVDALAAGAIIAYGLRVSDRQVIQRSVLAAFLLGTLSLVGLVSIAGTTVFWTPIIWGRLWYSPLVLTAMACAFAGAVGLAAIGHRWTRWLEFPPLMRWGKISYGIYLFHPFVFYLMDIVARHIGPPKSRLVSGSIMLVKLSLTYLLARISWILIEGPINSLKDRFSERAQRQNGASEMLMADKDQQIPKSIEQAACLAEAHVFKRDGQGIRDQESCGPGPSKVSS